MTNEEGRKKMENMAPGADLYIKRGNEYVPVVGIYPMDDSDGRIIICLEGP